MFVGISLKIGKKNTGASEFKAIGKQLITSIIHTIIDAIEEWAQSKNKRRQHLRNAMTSEGSSKRPREDKN